MILVVNTDERSWKKLFTLIGILSLLGVSSVALATIIVYYFSEKIPGGLPPTLPPTVPPTNVRLVLYVVTDKPCYHAGESILITVTNECNETVTFANTAYFTWFERWNGTSWELYPSIAGEDAMTPLKPRETGHVCFLLQDQLGLITGQSIVASSGWLSTREYIVTSGGWLPTGHYRVISGGSFEENEQTIAVWGYAQFIIMNSP